VTFGRRGVRETVGIPGTGLYATRIEPRVIGPTGTKSSEPMASAKPHAGPADYTLAVIVGMVLGVLIVAAGGSLSTAGTAAAITVAVGICYEWLAHHHPAAAKALFAAAAGLAVVAGAIAGALLLGALAAGASSNRRRRR
jgi:hypothetical protein